MSTPASQATPGPWVVGFHDVETDIHASADGTFIASCEGGGYNDKHAEANARLIAAAPALLDALQAIVNLAQEKEGRFTLTRVADVDARARAAIAAATGEQS